MNNDRISLYARRFDKVFAYIEQHLDDPLHVNASVEKFIEWRKASGLSDYTTQGTYGVPYNYPLTTPSENFRFDVCGELSPAANDLIPDNPQGVISKTAGWALCRGSSYGCV